MKRLAAIQSNYIPWRGFFDLVSRCDEYVILDGAQYAKRHWHNRNRIKTANGPIWLTIPVVTKSKFDQPIEEVLVAEPWAEKHWRSIELAYKGAQYFAETAPFVKTLYEEAARRTKLTEVNELFLRALVSSLGLKVQITRDSDYKPTGSRSERLFDLCCRANATEYLSGPSAKDYLDTDLFTSKRIDVIWMEYGPYAEYPQLHPPFDQFVSILDLLFNTGPQARTLFRLGAGESA